jgi:hypothetical protein
MMYFNDDFNVMMYFNDDFNQWLIHVLKSGGDVNYRERSERKFF